MPRDASDRAPAVPLIVGTAILLALMLTGLFATILVRNHNGDIAAAERRIQDLTDVLAEHASLVFDDIDRTLQAANKARDLLMRAGHWGPAAGDRPYQALLELRPGSAAAANLSWTDEHGDRLYAALTPLPLPLNVKTRPDFIAHRDNPSLGIHVGTPNLSQQTGKYLVPVTRRYDLPDGSFGGVTALLVDPLYFSTFYRATTRRQRLFIQLALADGTVIVREPSAVNIVGSSIAAGDLFAKHLPKASAGTFSTRSIIDGAERLISYKVIPNLPLVITVSKNRSDALADFYEDAIVLLAFYAALIGMVGGGAWLAIQQTRQRARRRRERAEAKDRLRQAEKQQALGTLVGGIAHEINNALLPIMTFGELVSETLPEGGFERDGVAHMVGSARQIEGLIKRVLDFSREEQASKTQIDLAGFLARFVGRSRAGLPKTIALTERIATDVGAVRADEEKLSQVFADLVANAATAIGTKPGTIEISASPAFERTASPQAGKSRVEFVRLSVKDDGPGIPPVVRERLFEPFFTTKEAGSGLGLGLYTARRVITELGGYLDVESEPGKGACVSIFLPRVPASMTVPEPAMPGG